MKKILLLSCAALILSSCVGTKGRIGKEPEPLKEITYEQVLSSINNNDLSDAFQDINYLAETGRISDPEKVKELRNKIAFGYQVQFNKYITEEDYFSAYNLIRSVRTAGISIDTGSFSDKNSLIEKLIFSDKKDMTMSEKLYFARKYIDFDILDDKSLKKLIDIAVKAEDTGFLEYVSGMVEKRKLSVGSDYERVLKLRYTSSQLIKGTVTIWVNRGMKIENGMGIPDRVIGSGFFIDRKGYIITNYHVISSEVDPEYEGYSRLYVKLSDDIKEKIPAKVIGWDKTFDIALLKIDTVPETVFHFGKDKRYEPGTPVIAIGSPGGLENTITSGIISAYGRKFLQMGSVMQVDAPINHGNSGGPLLDKENILIGVVFAGIEQFEGINFAIPSGYVVKLLPQLYLGGKVAHPFLGMSLYERNKALTVTYVTPGSSSSRGGLKEGDVIKAINGTEVNTVDEAQKFLLDLEPGMLVRIDWERNGEEYTRIFSLSVRPDLPVKDAYEKDATENLFLPLFGMKVQSVSSGLNGSDFIITDILEGSIADESGLSVNDPFKVQSIKEDTKNNILNLEIRIKRRKSGFLESGLMLRSYLETGDFI